MVRNTAGAGWADIPLNSLDPPGVLSIAEESIPYLIIN